MENSTSVARAAKDVASKKAAPRKNAAKKSTPKKSTPKKTVPKKTVPKKTAMKKTAMKKTATKRFPAPKAKNTKTIAKKTTPRKTTAARATAGKVTAGKAAAKKTTVKTSGRGAKPPSPPRVRLTRRVRSVVRAKRENGNEPLLSTAQARVVASKFAGPLVGSGTRPRPALPSTYGESRLLLLARDPRTLFAAWDMSPVAVEGLKARIGRRSFAVSSLTLRLIPLGGRPSVFHLAKRVRSRYLRIDGGPSFVAEIGFTTPAGHFELLARSVPCSVGTGEKRAGERGKTAGRSVLKYGQAAALAREGMTLLSVARIVGDRVGRPGTERFAPFAASPNSLTSRPPTARERGGASDLYRR